MARIDFELDDEFKLVDDDAGDFTEADSSETDAALICLLEKGELRYAPWLGFGLQQRIRGVEDPKRFVRELKVELENDSFINPGVDISEGIENFKLYV